MAEHLTPGAGIDPQQLAEIQRLTGGWSAEQLQWLSGYMSGLAATGLPAVVANDDDVSRFSTDPKRVTRDPLLRSCMKPLRPKACKQSSSLWVNLRKNSSRKQKIC